MFIIKKIKILKVDMHKNEAELCFADKESADIFYKKYNRLIIK
jgi:hypothetical protein